MWMAPSGGPVRGDPVQVSRAGLPGVQRDCHSMQDGQQYSARRPHGAHLCPGHFQQLLNESERALQDTFPGAFGDLYTQSARAFRDLYAELRLYYRGANLQLDDTLAEFWARLLERLFRGLHPQLLLPDDYLDCLGKQAEALRPFGDAPRELRLRATRAFVAARAFVQGLGVAGDVVRKVAQVRTAAPQPPVQSHPLPGWVRAGRVGTRTLGWTLRHLQGLCGQETRV